MSALGTAGICWPPVCQLACISFLWLPKQIATTWWLTMTEIHSGGQKSKISITGSNSRIELPPKAALPIPASGSPGRSLTCGCKSPTSASVSRGLPPCPSRLPLLPLIRTPVYLLYSLTCLTLNPHHMLILVP